MIPTSCDNSPYSKDIIECSVRNVSTTLHFSWCWFSMACAFTWSLCLWLLLWGYLKSKVSTSKPRTMEELKQKMKEEITAILEQMTRRVLENLWERLEHCLRNGGRHLKNEIFKNKMACTEFFTDSECYVIRWNIIVLFCFENCQVVLPHPIS
jgi:hypothetical protein